jgi:hypothetical protein
MHCLHASNFCYYSCYYMHLRLPNNNNDKYYY